MAGAERPGDREVRVRSDKAGNPELRHKEPAYEAGMAGIAYKSSQAAPGVPSTAAAAAAQVIADGETFVINQNGSDWLDDSFLPAGAVEGSRLYIEHATDALVLAATALTDGAMEAGYSKFGIVNDIDADAGRFEVNLNARSSF